MTSISRSPRSQSKPQRGVTRRHMLAGAAGLLAAPLLRTSGADAQTARPKLYIADMHFHLFFGVGRRPAHTQPLGPSMARAEASLVSWSIVGDMPWLKAEQRTFVQKGQPTAGEPSAWLADEAARVKAHVADNKLALVRTPADVAAAKAGRPHVVLAVEGATFADDGLAQLRAAYDLGVRHLQLVHFIDNRIGDMQTARAAHGGLSDFGRTVVAECNRLGILIDLAHCTERAVDQVLEQSRAPVVWSHSSVHVWPRLLPVFTGWKRRQLSLAAAKRIAAKGGVIGLWALGDDVGTTPLTYAERVLDLTRRLGEDHVAFGTDMNALSRPALSSLSDLRVVVDLLLARGAPVPLVAKVAMDNFARVLITAMERRGA